MASAERKVAILDAPARALWRVAEHGDVAELHELLPRVTNINARNEHGVTALMRAAQNGHLQMVRALLEHGADANIKRNDKFTALALAAFFGHTKVVRALMEHGADSHAATRGGTSPQMWATARTFNEVVDQLEKPTAAKREPVSERVTAMKQPQPVAPQEPLVVRTLKDPPEIWDLVHEAPRGFDARATFVARVKSIKTGFAFRAATAVVFISLCVVGVLVLRSVQARNEKAVGQRPAAATNVSSETVSSQPITPQPVVAQPVTSQPAAQAENSSAPAALNVASSDALAQSQITTPATGNNKPVAVRKFSSRIVSSRPIDSAQAPPVSANETAAPVVSPSEKSESPARVETTVQPKTAVVPLSPQLIATPKASTTKTKVIQWP